MKQLWQLSHDEIENGSIALAHCQRCHGDGVFVTTQTQFDGESLVEIERQIVCDCRQEAQRLLSRANVPGGRFKAAALGDLDWQAIQPARTRTTVQLYVERFNEVLAQGIGLTMIGDVGTGKTHVAIGLVKLACSVGIEARFYSTPDLLARLRATYGSGNGHRRTCHESEDDVLEELARVPLLALDDLGVGKPSDWVRDRLYTLINRRYVAQRPTITTSNENLQTLAMRLGKRITSRLAGASLEVTFEGQDYRSRTRDHLLKDLGMGWTDVWTRCGH